MGRRKKSWAQKERDARLKRRNKKTEEANAVEEKKRKDLEFKGAWKERREALILRLRTMIMR